MGRILPAVLCVSLLGGCKGGESSGGTSKASVPTEMQYIKTREFYDVVTDMYNNPDNYLGGSYHLVGKLYSVTGDDGTVYYSVTGSSLSDRDESIGIELHGCDCSNLTVGDTITVEGTLATEKGEIDGEQREFLILNVSKLEKRD